MGKQTYPSGSIFNRLISHHRSLQATAGISLLLLSLPIIALFLDNSWEAALQQGYWRPLFLPPVVTIYILVISPFLAYSDAEVLTSIRPIILLDDEQYVTLVERASRISPVGELIAFAAGLGFGILMSQFWFEEAPSLWLGIYLPLALGLMFGLLSWVIYNAFSSTRLTSALHRQPMAIDIFDIRPFDPIGRQSFLQALVFVGGISLSMLFGLNLENIRTWQTWLFYLVLGLVPVLVFFLNMRDAHRILAAEKKRQLETVSVKIHKYLLEINQRIADEVDLGALASEFNVLLNYETRLRAARTWPYNTAMLRTIFATILFPLLIRGISTLLFDF